MIHGGANTATRSRFPNLPREGPSRGIEGEALMFDSNVGHGAPPQIRYRPYCGYRGTTVARGRARLEARLDEHSELARPEPAHVQRDLQRTGQPLAQLEALCIQMCCMSSGAAIERVELSPLVLERGRMREQRMTPAIPPPGGPIACGNCHPGGRLDHPRGVRMCLGTSRGGKM